MIYCPKCGTANRDGSRFCNECGEKLSSQTKVKCPQCGAQNSIQSVFCSECGGRLLPETDVASDMGAPSAIKGLSLPTKAPADDEEEPVHGAGSPSEDGGPAWLRELGATLSTEEVDEPVSDQEAEEIPDWLHELRAALPPEPEDQVSEADEAQDEQAPDWLAELRPPVVEEEPSLEAGLEVGQEAGEETGQEEGQEAGLDEEEIPDWLADLRPPVVEEGPSLEAGQEEGQEAGLDEEEIPDWLADLRPPVVEEEPSLEAGLEEGQEAGSDEGEIPDWLAELRPPVAEEEPSLEAGLEEGQEAGLDEEEIPDWLAEGEEEEEEAGLEAGSDEGEISDWLVRSEEDWEREGDSLRHAEIPAWLLALKPQELREKDEEAPPEPAVAEEPVEETGLLAGLQGILPVEMLIARPRSVGPAEPPAVVTDTPQARLFAEIVGKPPEAATTTVLQPRKGLLAKLPLLILYIVLIGAVALPQLLTETLVPRVVEATPAVTSLHDAIESLDSGAPVLVAFDYDPTTSGEMDVVAETIIRHLMERQARVVVVSLLPAGPATAESVLEGLVADGYANLGYIPGQAAAIRLLGQSVDRARPRDFYGVPLSDLAVMEGLINIQSFELLVELAPDQDTLRWWIEQGAMPSGVPLVAGVSASVEPLARAYYETEARQLVGMIGGVPGAAAYDALRGGSDSLNGTLGTRMDSQLAGHLVFVVVLLIGNGVYVVRRLSGRGR